MTIKKLSQFFSIIILVPLTYSFGQTVTPSLSNLVRYGNGERLYGEVGKRQTYFEDLSDVRISLPENFVVGFRYLMDDPPEVGPVFRGIKRRYVEFAKGGFYLRAGNSSTLFGRGLALNLFENRGLDYDTWMDGVKASYQKSFIKGTIVGGRIDFRDSITFVRNETYKIRGGNLEVTPIDPFLLGASYIYSEGVIPQGVQGSGVPAKDIRAEIPEFYASLNLQSISFYVDWSQKWTNVISDNRTATGWGLYGAFSYLGDGYGITVDYKNYRYNIQDPYGRSDNASPTRMLPFQNPPIVQREYSFTLLSRALHQVNFNDEVGFQVEAFYSLGENTNLTFNTSLSSIHYKYLLRPDGFSFREVKRNFSFLPSTKKEYFPYFELFAELEQYFNTNDVLHLAYALREETFYNEFSTDKSSTITRSMVIPVEYQHDFNEDYSITVESELEFVGMLSSQNNLNYINHFLQARATFYSTLTANVRFEYTTSNIDPSGKKHWALGELGYRITPSNIVSLSYGQERGGQICANGVCRYIQPFSGFRFSLQTQF